MAADSVIAESVAPSAICETSNPKAMEKSATPQSALNSENRRPLLSRSQTTLGNPPCESPRISRMINRPMSRSYSQESREIMVHPSTAIRTWQRLEALRMRNLGIKGLPRGFMVARTYGYKPIEDSNADNKLPPLRREATMSLICQDQQPLMTFGNDNGVAPFKTLQKPTCGYFFSFGTNHKKIRHGLSPADVPKWRSMNFSSP